MPPSDEEPAESFYDEGIEAARLDGSSTAVAPGTGTSIRVKMLERHDSFFSVSSEYEDPSGNDLNLWQGAALLTADCMGTGLLALPEDVQVWGRWIGLGFLLLNLPINLYAGTILSSAAGHVEASQKRENAIYEARQREVLDQIQEDRAQERESSDDEEEEGHPDVRSNDGLMVESQKQIRGNCKKDYASVSTVHVDADEEKGGDDFIDYSDTTDPRINPHHTVHHDTATFDFIGMTQALFSSRTASRWVMLLFYTNIFLVLGDYILVMSHAVSALVGEEELCIPTAGILASTLMFGVSQTRTMAKLGRTATVISLSSLFIVVVQCLVAVYNNPSQHYSQASAADYVQVTKSFESNLLRKFSALGSIGFAVGSQKLFLNIRHELSDRSQAPKSLAISLSTFGFVYVGIILLAGTSKFTLCLRMMC